MGGQQPHDGHQLPTGEHQRPPNSLSKMQRKWVEAEFNHLLELKDGSFDEFQRKMQQQWGRPLTKELERLWAQIGDGKDLQRPNEDRIKQVWDAILKSS